jgi:FAD/FMN-containing dehydrogenase
VTEARWIELQLRIEGAVITPDDPRYDEARQAWNLTVDQHPAVIVMAASAADVMTAVQFGASEGLNVTVQSTGHGIVRLANDSLLIITSKMKKISVDAAAQTAWIEAGAK